MPKGRFYTKEEKDNIINLYVNDNLTPTQISKIANRTPGAIKCLLKINDIISHKPIVPVSWDTTKVDYTNPVFNYYCGLLVTDGFIDDRGNRVSLRLHEKDKDIIIKLGSYFNRDIKSYYVSKFNSYNYDITLTGKYLRNYLSLHYNLHNNKTFTCSMPTTFYDPECLRYYIRGVIDGDGSIRSNEVRIYCGSETFIEGLILLLNKTLDVNLKKDYIYRDNKTRKYPGFRSNKKDTYTLCNWLYKDYDGWGIERKYKRYKKACKIMI